MVAVAVVLLVQLPPPGASLNIIKEPVQTNVGPAMVPGTGLIVTAETVLQPGANEYVIADIPAAIPVTTPVEETMVAIVVLALVQLPPDAVLESVVVAPWQIEAMPVLGISES